MRTPVFLTYCVVIFALFLESYSFFRRQFSGYDILKAKKEHLEHELGKQELRALLAEYQLEDFRQQVATLMPAALRGTAPGDSNTYPLRDLASVATRGTGALNIERASSLFQNGRLAFRENQFEESNQTFQKLLLAYPSSVHAVETHFLLAEGQYQLKEFEVCIETIDAMISLYPESVLTGFALLRLGKIFEAQDRLEDAVEIYKAILASYGDDNLLRQARISLKAVAL